MTAENGKERILRALLPLLPAALCLLLGLLVFRSRLYLFVSLTLAFLALSLFYAGYETRTVGSRRLVVTVVMTVLGLIGRLIPYLKPVGALAILSGVFLGPGAGFLVGSMCAFLPNFFLGQGPWTPFQMLAWGAMGAAAGLLAPVLKKSRVLLLTYGAVSGIAYSMIMDVWTVLWYHNGFSLKLYGAAQLTALPYTVLYAVSNVVFLLLLAGPVGNKLERIRVKYGI